MADKTTTLDIELHITPDEFKEMAETNPVAAAQHLDGEIQKFEEWMLGRGLDPLTRYETQILREYLGFKIVS